MLHFIKQLLTGIIEIRTSETFLLLNQQFLTKSIKFHQNKSILI